jgi:hypothetical protein
MPGASRSDRKRVGILRLRKHFALRSVCCAQDDNGESLEAGHSFHIFAHRTRKNGALGFGVTFLRAEAIFLLLGDAVVTH